LLKRLKPIIEERCLIPPHQFGFRENHSTVEQVHRITDVIEDALENKKICSSIFLDVAQAFDEVWHQGLEFKLQRDLPKQFYQILKSYIADRHFRVKFENEYSELKRISAGIPQGSVLGPILFILYTRDLPNIQGTTVATFADDTAILAVGKDISEATSKLQNAVNTVSNWTKKWRISLNEAKSVHVNFTNKNVNCIPVVLNSNQIPYANTAKYLGMTLDVKLRWKEHIKKKIEELNIKYRKMYWLMGRNSELSIPNKLLLYR
jgi:transposase